MQAEDSSLHYKLIDARARPARIAVLINSSDPDWHHTAVRVIEFLSSLWGGKHSVIVPTDGSTIAPIFWGVLEEFSPDYVYSYQKTWDDIRISRPPEYEAVLRKTIEKYASEANTEGRDQIDQALRTTQVDGFGLAPNLRSEIASRLIPFHYNEHFEHRTGRHVPHQLTGIADVLPFIDHAPNFTCFQVATDVDEIWWAAYTGSYAQKTIDELSQLGMNKNETVVSVEELEDFMRWLTAGHVDSLRLEMNKALGEASAFIPPTSTRPVPFDVSMSRVDLYGSPLSNDAVADRIAIIFGDSLADFCLAYCLRRIGHGAIWLPAAWIRNLESGDQGIFRSWIASTVHAIPYEVRHHHGIKVCSASEREEVVSDCLEVLRKRIGLGLNGEIVTASEPIYIVEQARDAPIPYCIDSPNRSEIYPFIGQRSVGTIRTPRPTGFSKISASRHKWITELRIVETAIPSLPGIADYLLLLPQSVSGVSTRVTHQALAYTSPGLGLVIGDDINANLRHPELRLFDTFSALSTIAAEGGFESQLSDKGIYQRDALAKFGSLPAAAKYTIS
jgi:hypothetical protein